MSLITRCPHCSTRYKVVPDQLRLASGWVRCGQCDQMFDGRAHLQPEPAPSVVPGPQEGGDAAEATAPAPSPEATAPAALAVPQIPAAFRAEAVLDSQQPGLDAGEGETSEQASLALERALASMLESEPADEPQETVETALETALASGTDADVDSVWVPKSEPFLLSGHEDGPISAQPLEPDWRAELAALAGATESDATPELEPNSLPDPALALGADSGLDFFTQSRGGDVSPVFDAFDGLDAAPSFELSLPPEEILTAAPVMLDSVLAGGPDVEPALLESPPETAQEHDGVLGASSNPSAGALDEPPLLGPIPPAEPDDSGVLSFVARAERRAFWRTPAMRGVLGLAAVLLGLGLAGQLALQNRDWLAARHPGLTEPLNRLCQPLGCAVQPWRAAEAVVIDNSSFSRAGPNGFRFVLTLRNTARLPVATPALELILTDENQQTLLRRVVLPHELDMPDTLAPRSEFEARRLIALTQAAEPEKVVNYRLVVFYP